MTRADPDPGSRGGNALVQLLAVALPPLAALGMQELSYTLVPYTCVTRRTGLLHLVPIGMLALTALAAWGAWRSWQGAGARTTFTGGDPASRAAFLGFLGVMMSALMTLVIVAQWIAVFMFHPCHQM